MSVLETMEPFSRKPIAERVADRLLGLIRSGNLKAGDKLPTENELAEAMHVSRPIVREALRGLSIMGVVESRQGGRCYVTDLAPERLLGPLELVIALDESNVNALYEARVVVECGLIRAAAAKVTDENLALLRDLAEAGYRRASDPVGFRVLDQEFHTLLMKLAGNPVLERVAASLYQLGMEFRRAASETPGVLDRSAAEHDAIVQALASRDPDRADDAMRTHLQSINRTTFEAMKKLSKEPRGEDAA
jgi:GntR family transcriptional regulator, transcriptional repressor for pyruvate dehydrogenase complex